MEETEEEGRCKLGEVISSVLDIFSLGVCQTDRGAVKLAFTCGYLGFREESAQGGCYLSVNMQSYCMAVTSTTAVLCHRKLLVLEKDDAQNY
jgi:hypothetical protein